LKLGKYLDGEQPASGLAFAESSPSPTRHEPMVRPSVHQTALREWAYVRAYQNPQQRSAELLDGLHRYNLHRPHACLKAKTPVSRLRSFREQPVEAPQLHA
jgi:transposase InsO family protein